ncbi:MAG: DNA-binding protein [Hyphomicrobiales bacterium]|jgi:predicted RNase H-like HicB family nuclease|nr:DNA-binding protein [Hyphomicrobiales bacterium]
MTHYVGILDGHDDVWGVRVPDLPGVHGGGATAEAAIADAISAAREWAASVAAKGTPIPNPRPLAEVLAEVEADEAPVMIPLLLDKGRTVKANVTFDAGLLEAIDAEAKQRGLTRAAFLASAARDKIIAG